MTSTITHATFRCSICGAACPTMREANAHPLRCVAANDVIHEEAEARWCEVCEEAEGEPLTVPTPEWPFRTCRRCTEAFDDMAGDNPEGNDAMIDEAVIQRFGAPALQHGTRRGVSSAFDGTARA